MTTAFQRLLSKMNQLMYCTCGDSTHYIAEISYSRSFLHYLKTDCSRFHSLRQQTPFSALIKIFYLLVNFFKKNPFQPPFRGHFPQSRGTSLNRSSSVIDKMNFYSIRGILLTWLTSYLAHREQYDMVHHHVSSFNNVACVGLPKALFFGPLLFLQYIIDLFHSSSHLSLILFAYDTIYLYVINTWLLKQILIKSSFLFPLGLMQINSLPTLRSLRSLL